MIEFLFLSSKQSHVRSRDETSAVNGEIIYKKQAILKERRNVKRGIYMEYPMQHAKACYTLNAILI